MTDAERLARNMTRLGECYYVFQQRVSAILKYMEKLGWRPRIQDAYRTPEVQEGKKLTGVSKLARGFHNTVGVMGRPEALAVDILNDDDPVWPKGWQEEFPTLYPTRLRFALDLARAAAANGCRTGISWGLDPEARVLVQKAVAGQREGLKTIVGWDPLHVEPADITVAAALDGARPKAMAPGVASLSGNPIPPTEAAPPGPSMSEAIELTKWMTLPPIGQTQGPDGSMTQLEGDIRYWLDHRAAGMDWEAFSTRFGVVAGRIRRLYPQYLLWGVRSMIQARYPGEIGPAWDRFGNAAGPVVGAKLREYLVDWGVTP